MVINFAFMICAACASSCLAVMLRATGAAFTKREVANRKQMGKKERAIACLVVVEERESRMKESKDYTIKCRKECARQNESGEAPGSVGS